MDRQEVLDLLKLDSQQDFSMVYGWYLHEILSCLEASSTLVLDDEIRNIILRHTYLAQQFLDNKTERQNLVQTRALAVFISNSLAHATTARSTPSCPTLQLPIMSVLLKQQQGFFPFLLMHSLEPAVVSWLEILLKCNNITPELHVIVGHAICTELCFQCPKVLNGNLIWKVEKIALLLSTFIETIPDDNQGMLTTVASFLDPLSHFILKFTGPSYCAEYLFIRLVYLVINKYSESAFLRKLIPQFLQAISWNISSLMTLLKFYPMLRRQSPESDGKRRMQLQVIELMEVLLQYKKEYYEVIERMANHQVVERVCSTVFAPECSTTFNAAGVSFIRAILVSGCPHLLPSKLVKGFIAAIKASPKRFPHYTILCRELYKMPEFAPYFTPDVVEVVQSTVIVKKHSPRKTLKQVLAQRPLREREIVKCLYYMLSSNDHPYGMVLAGFGRGIEKSYEKKEDMDLVIADSKATLDTFAQSIAETLKIEEISLNIVPFDFDGLCVDACYEAICANPIILSCYHQKFADKDKIIYEMCEKLGPCVTLAQVNVDEKFFKEASPEGEGNEPFSKAIAHFKKFSRKKTPMGKIQVLRETIHSICNTGGKSVEIPSSHVTADDLMATLTYVILKSKIKTLYSESEFIHEFLAKQHLAGEQGYLATTLQCCCMFISSPEFVETSTEGAKLPAPTPA